MKNKFDFIHLNAFNDVIKLHDGIKSVPFTSIPSDIIDIYNDMIISYIKYIRDGFETVIIKKDKCVYERIGSSEFYQLTIYDFMYDKIIYGLDYKEVFYLSFERIEDRLYLKSIAIMYDNYNHIKLIEEAQIIYCTVI